MLTPSTNVDVAAWSLVDTCPTNGLVFGTITLDEAYTGDITFTVTSHQMKVHGWNPTGGSQVVPVNDATSASFSIQVTQVSSADKYRVDITDSSPHLGCQLISEPFFCGNTGGGCGELGTSTPTPTATPSATATATAFATSTPPAMQPTTTFTPSPTKTANPVRTVSPSATTPPKESPTATPMLTFTALGYGRDIAASIRRQTP